MTDERMRWIAAGMGGAAALVLGGVGALIGNSVAKRNGAAIGALAGATTGAALVASTATTYWGQKLPAEQLALGSCPELRFP